MLKGWSLQKGLQIPFLHFSTIVFSDIYMGFPTHSQHCDLLYFQSPPLFDDHFRKVDTTGARLNGTCLTVSPHFLMAIVLLSSGLFWLSV